MAFTRQASVTAAATFLEAFTAVKDGRGKRAVTHWTRLDILRDAALVECRLETGRTHQVRVHLAGIGHPLCGESFNL